MPLSRRKFIHAAAAFATTPGLAHADYAFAPKPGAWRHFEVTTRIELPNAKGGAQTWIPAPSVNEGDWFRSLATKWTTNAGEAALATDAATGAAMVHARFGAAETAPWIEATSRISSRDRALDLATSAGSPTLAAELRARYTSPTTLIPINGIVRQKSDEITRNASSDIEKARRVYQWIVENAYRDPKTRGCGSGDIASMLESGNLGGKCADLNALLVGLCRAAGIPARDIYGIRVAPSKFGYRSLGAASADITKAQHCRSEAWFEGFGWAPLDPADVRKVILEEPPGNLAISDEKVVAARKTLFGAWEGNWLAYNFGSDVTLSGSKTGKVDFLMYPQAEIGGELMDSLDPDTFKYRISVKELESI